MYAIRRASPRGAVWGTENARHSLSAASGNLQIESAR